MVKEDGLSLEPDREDDGGSGLLPHEVEDDRPKRREDSEEVIKTERDNGEVEKGNDEDCISERDNGEVEKGNNEDCISDSGSEVESGTNTNAEEREQRKKKRIMCEFNYHT